MLKNAVVLFTTFAFVSAADDTTQLDVNEQELLDAISMGASDEVIMGMLEADGLLASTLDDIDLIGAPPVGELNIEPHMDLNKHGHKRDLEWEHGKPLFSIDDLVDLKVDLLKLKVDLKMAKKEHFNPKEYKYELKDLLKLKDALFKLQDIFKHNPTHLGGTHARPLLGKIVLKELIQLVEEVIKLLKEKSVIKKILLKFDKKLIIGKPEFGIHDLIQLQKLLVEFKRELLHPKFHTLDPKYFPYGLEQLKKLKIALLKVKIILVNQPKYFGSALPFKIFNFYDVVDEIIKNKIWKAKKIDLLFNKHGKPQFGADKIFELEAVLLKFKKDLNHLNPKSYKEHAKFFMYKLDDLTKLKVALLKLKIFVLTNPHHFHTHLPVDKIIDLLSNLIEVVKLLAKVAPDHKPHKPNFGNGKCSGEVKDLRLLRNIRKTVFACGEKFHDDKHGIQQCVQKETHLSKKCSSCFGDFAVCAAKQCWFTCAFKSDHDCNKCADDECTKPLTKCAFGDWTHTWKSAIGFSWKVNGNRRRVNFLETMNFQ